MITKGTILLKKGNTSSEGNISHIFLGIHSFLVVRIQRNTQKIISLHEQNRLELGWNQWSKQQYPKIWTINRSLHLLTKINLLWYTSYRAKRIGWSHPCTSLTTSTLDDNWLDKWHLLFYPKTTEREPNNNKKRGKFQNQNLKWP